MPSDPHVVKESEGGDQGHGHSDRAADRGPLRSDAHLDGVTGPPGGTAKRVTAVASHPSAGGDDSNGAAGPPGDARGARAHRVALSPKK